MHTRSITRAASYAAAGTLAASVVAIAAPANAAPADPDLTGTVVSPVGAPLAGVYVTAYTTPADGTRPRAVASAVTNASGVYTFTKLDPASLAAGSSNPAITTETDFKLYFEWFPNLPADYHSTGYLDRGLGGTETVGAAASVVVPANAAATAPTQALPVAAGVVLTVTGPTGTPVNDYASGSLYEPEAYDPLDAAAGGSDSEYDDEFYPDTNGDGDPDAPKDGVVYIPGVEPGKYAVSGSGNDTNPTTGSTTYVSRFFGGNGSYTTAKPVEAKAGAFTPVTIQLSDKLTALQEPRIVGNSSIGSKLKADPGVWLRQQGTEFTYQWLRGDKVVSTDDTYKVTKKDRKKKIRLTVTAYNGGFVGTASVKTGKVGEKSKVTATKAANGAYAVTVRVVKKALIKKLGVPSGKVVLMTTEGETASKKVALKGGKAVVKPRAKFEGEKLVVMYLGSNVLGSDTVALGGGGKKK